jgi:hypothetical protein
VLEARGAALAEAVESTPSAEAPALALPQWGAYTSGLLRLGSASPKAEVSMVKGERDTQHKTLLTMPPAVATRAPAAAGGAVSSALCCVPRSHFPTLTLALDRLSSRCRKFNVYPPHCGSTSASAPALGMRATVSAEAARHAVQKPRATKRGSGTVG